MFLANGCAALGYIERGRILPESCSSQEVRIGDRCKIYCRRGFKPKGDMQYLTCEGDSQWNPLVQERDLRNICIEGRALHYAFEISIYIVTFQICQMCSFDVQMEVIYVSLYHTVSVTWKSIFQNPNRMSTGEGSSTRNLVTIKTMRYFLDTLLHNRPGQWH